MLDACVEADDRAAQQAAREQIRFGEKLWEAFGSRGPSTIPNEHRNLWVDRAFHVLRGHPGNWTPRGGESWYGEHAPLFEVSR